ncbi:hypothetical protein CsSME_00009491 [Camellia sinensis var. sinensis]
MISGNLEVIFPAASHAYAPVVEELWKDRALQATYNRRNEICMLPKVANYFLDRCETVASSPRAATLCNYRPSDRGLYLVNSHPSQHDIL